LALGDVPAAKLFPDAQPLTTITAIKITMT